jgi:hypothetical protein
VFASPAALLESRFEQLLHQSPLKILNVAHLGESCLGSSGWARELGTPPVRSSHAALLDRLFEQPSHIDTYQVLFRLFGLNVLAQSPRRPNSRRPCCRPF